jgi:hypothetical protein
MWFVYPGPMKNPIEWERAEIFTSAAAPDPRSQTPDLCIQISCNLNEFQTSLKIELNFAGD